MNAALYEQVRTLPVTELVERWPLAADFLANMRLPDRGARTLPQLLETLDEGYEEAFGLRREDVPLRLCAFLETFQEAEAPREERVEELTILGGRDKSGAAEDVVLTLRRGEVTAIVGPTGSGKSRLLGDIECLAQGDTPTGRTVRVNGRGLSDEERFDMDGKLVAQLSQNMNFVMDLTVAEFLELHAKSRLVRDVSGVTAACLACANSLAGESFGADVKVTQLSGGQSRALMIADAAFMSSSPLVLIDEIENAGIDRKRAVEVLSGKDKIVLIATHDPLLALEAGRRIVIKNGGIHAVYDTDAGEKAALEELERIDGVLQDLRGRLRAGERISGL